MVAPVGRSVVAVGVGDAGGGPLVGVKMPPVTVGDVSPKVGEVGGRDGVRVRKRSVRVAVTALVRVALKTGVAVPTTGGSVGSTDNVSVGAGGGVSVGVEVKVRRRSVGVLVALRGGVAVNTGSVDVAAGVKSAGVNERRGVRVGRGVLVGRSCACSTPARVSHTARQDSPNLPRKSICMLRLRSIRSGFQRQAVADVESEPSPLLRQLLQPLKCPIEGYSRSRSSIPIATPPPQGR